MPVTDKVRDIVERVLTTDQFLVDIILKGKVTGQKLIVLVDGDQGITIDQCARISRQLSEQLDELDLISGKYQLEVSSPGLDHPISMKRQFVKNQGRNLSIETEEEQFRGKLVKVGEHLTLEVKEKKKVNKVDIPFTDIIKANVLVSFK